MEKVISVLIPEEDAEILNYFQTFVKNYGKTYSSVEEYWRRFGLFKKMYKGVQEANRLVPHADPPFAINTFADRSPEEYLTYYAGFIYPTENNM